VPEGRLGPRGSWAEEATGDRKPTSLFRRRPGVSPRIPPQPRVDGGQEGQFRRDPDADGGLRCTVERDQGWLLELGATWGWNCRHGPGVTRGENCRRGPFSSWRWGRPRPRALGAQARRSHHTSPARLGRRTGITGDTGVSSSWSDGRTRPYSWARSRVGGRTNNDEARRRRCEPYWSGPDLRGRYLAARALMLHGNVTRGQREALYSAAQAQADHYALERAVEALPEAEQEWLRDYLRQHPPPPGRGPLSEKIRGVIVLPWTREGGHCVAPFSHGPTA
jgi:hypothetical protein